MKRIVPHYVEQAAFRMRGSPNIIEELCKHYPDTMRWLAYYIGVYLGLQEDQERRALEALDKKKGTEGETPVQEAQH
jgi:hypothetical protein